MKVHRNDERKRARERGDARRNIENALGAHGVNNTTPSSRTFRTAGWFNEFNEFIELKE